MPARPTATETIDKELLRVGMFVCLNMAWSAHPFPVSNFLLATPAELAAVLAVAPRYIRWLPAASQAVPLRAEAPRAAAVARCSGQIDDIAHELAGVLALLPHAPEQARRSAEALAGAVVRKVVDAPAACVHALCADAGYRGNAERQPPAVDGRRVAPRFDLLPETHAAEARHATHVALLALLLARTLAPGHDALPSLGDDALPALVLGALLHDIGKVDLPPQSQALQAQHVALGVASGRRMGLQPEPLRVIAEHHELGDGSGFPLRRTGANIDRAAAIVALVNRYDNLCNPLPPAAGVAPHAALAQLFADDSFQFDAPLLAAFIRTLGVYPPGSLVQLSDDRFARVADTHAARPLRPPVQVFDAGQRTGTVHLLRLDDAAAPGIRCGVMPTQLPPALRRWLVAGSEPANGFGGFAAAAPELVAEQAAEQAAG